MRLYPKKLRGIEDLEREKKLLLKESKRLDKDMDFSLDGVLGKKGGAKDTASSILDILPVSNPVVSTLVKLVQARLAKTSNESTVASEPGKRKNVVKSAAFEFIGGYLKWKAIELSYKGIRRLIRNAKQKRNDNY